MVCREGNPGEDSKKDSTYVCSLPHQEFGTDQPDRCLPDVNV